MRRAFAENGYAVVEAVLDPSQCQALITHLSTAEVGRAGSRNLLEDACCARLAVTLKEHPAIARCLPVTAVAVQCTLFDKSPARNWLVALHQDLSIPVRERTSHPDCSGWSEKEGVLFVQPPTPVLESLVGVRVHLDECGPGAGALRVVPGSHRHGRLTEDAAREQRRARGDSECLVRRGDALLLRPLLLHASSKVTAAVRRRVLHFVFGPPRLPHGLEWNGAL